ncbi:MAG TPA: hypothetical protein VGE77_03030 [Nocardioides sp.]
MRWRTVARWVGLVLLVAYGAGMVAAETTGAVVPAATEARIGKVSVTGTSGGVCTVRDGSEVSRFRTDRVDRSASSRSLTGAFAYLRPGRIVSGEVLQCTRDVRVHRAPWWWLLLPAHGSLATIVVGAGLLAASRRPRDGVRATAPGERP